MEKTTKEQALAIALTYIQLKKKNFKTDSLNMEDVVLLAEEFLALYLETLKK